MTGLFAQFGGMGFAELREVDPCEFRAFADEFGEVMRSLPFQLAQNSLLLIRAMSLTSGVCSGLDPGFNLWDAVEPYAAKLTRDESGRLVTDFVRQAEDTAILIWRLPGRIDDPIDRLEDGRIEVDTTKLEQPIARLERLGRRATSTVVTTGMLVVGVRLRTRLRRSRLP